MGIYIKVVVGTDRIIRIIMVKNTSGQKHAGNYRSGGGKELRDKKE